MSGVPGEIIHVWKLTDANALVSTLESAREHPAHQATVDRLGEQMSRERHRLVVDAGYAPELMLSTHGQEARYFQARLTVAYGQADRIGALVAGLRDVLEPTVGWRLAAAYRTVVGEHDELIDLWEIPAGEPFEEALGRAAAVPEFGEVGGPAAEISGRRGDAAVAPNPVLSDGRLSDQPWSTWTATRCRRDRPRRSAPGPRRPAGRARRHSVDRPGP